MRAGISGRASASRAVLSFLLLSALAGPAAPQPAPTRAKSLDDEYLRLRAVNAVLRARLSLSKQTEPYLVLDIPEKQVRLELQGVTLMTVPVRKVSLNHLAREISRDTTGIGFCEVPFVLQQDRWFEEVPTLAVKDTAAVMNRPDTTGALVEKIRTTQVLALLRFERNLELALDGNIPPASRVERWKKRLRTLWRSYQPDTPEGVLSRKRREAVLIELEMDPVQVRSLAPDLTEGTKLVLRF